MDSGHEQSPGERHRPYTGSSMSFTSISVGARRIANLAIPCKEMRSLCYLSAWPVLASRVPKIAWEDFNVNTTEDGRLAPIWDTVLGNPTSCKLSELQDAARQFQVKQSGVTTAEVILRLLEFLCVPEPLPIPAAILFHIKFEKSQNCTAERTGSTIALHSEVFKLGECNIFTMHRVLEQDHRCVDEASYQAVRLAFEAQWQQEQVRNMQRATEESERRRQAMREAAERRHQNQQAAFEARRQHMLAAREGPLPSNKVPDKCVSWK